MRKKLLEKKYELYCEATEEFEDNISREDMLKVADEMEKYITEARKHDKLVHENQKKIDELETEIENSRKHFEKFIPTKESLVSKYGKEIFNNFDDIIPNIYPEAVVFHLDNNCRKLAKLEQFYGIVASDREEEELQNAEEFIREIRNS